MLSGFIDHLWQSSGFFAAVFVLAYLTRRNSAALRLWSWRIAALKFLLPFGLWFALGAWIGFPGGHSAVPPPAALTELVTRGMSLAAPARTFDATEWTQRIALLLALALAALC